ncbi:hypothetical protein ABT298_30180 [Streptomyces sp. NPDC001034]|uniref:hypothetical protein n=1 Tax=Streptomyces sp. NPDC001034 TaxID=3154375 RepID=UPI003323D4EB
MQEGLNGSWGGGGDVRASGSSDLDRVLAIGGLVGQEREGVAEQVAVAGFLGGAFALLVQAGRVGWTSAVEGCPSGLLCLLGEEGLKETSGLLGEGGCTQEVLRLLILADAL